MKYPVILFLLMALLVSGFACKKKAKKVSDNPVPSVLVDISIYTQNPFYTKIQNIGGWVYNDGGINGIIIYRKSDQEFVVLERTSSQLPDNAKAKVYVMKDNFTLIDSISGSQWRMFDGSVTKGPAEWGLRLYGASFDGSLLRIRN